MPLAAAFHSVNEIDKPQMARVHHTNSACPLGRAIAPSDRRPGMGTHRLCDDCCRLNRQDAAPPPVAYAQVRPPGNKSQQSR
jgi:hypothetical protein